MTDIPDGERVSATMAAAIAHDQEIIEGLPITVCRTVADTEVLVKYLAASIKALNSVERDALLFQCYLNSLTSFGVVSVPEGVLQATLSRRVKVPEAADDDD